MPPQKHARLGGSKAKRWINCPASVLLEDEFPDQSSSYAREGTAAHEVAEECLRDEREPVEFLGDMRAVFYEEDGETIETYVKVTEEMVEAVGAFVEYVRSRVDEGDELFIEQRFDLSPLNPPDPMFGTADVVVWHPDDLHLEVIDFKYGKGVAVDAEGNHQLRQYGLGTVVELRKKPARITLTIGQPRAHHEAGPFRSWEITFDDLKEWKKEAWAAGKEAVESDDPAFQVGDWCRFCKAKAVCPAQREHAMVVAQDVFEVEVPEEDEEHPLVAPEALTDEQMIAILDRKAMIEQYLKAVHDHAVSLLERGLPVEGYKLVEGRSHRRWTDEEEAEAYLANKGLKQDERLKMKIISPYQAEKALKRAGHDLDRLRKLDKLIDKPEGKPKLVPADHPKPALTPVAQEVFEADPDATEGGDEE